MTSFRPLARLAALLALAFAPLTVSAQGRSVTGTYTTTVNSPQGALKAVITITGDKSAYTGTLTADGFPVMPVSKVTPSDTGVAIAVDTPDGGVTVSMKFVTPTTVQGTLVYQGMPMGIDGTFAPAGAGGAGITPTGSYSLVTTQPLMGAPAFDIACTVQLAAGGSYSGTCGNPEAGDVPIGSVTTAGNVVTIAGDTPNGPYKLVLTITGAAADGMVTIGNETAKLKGTFTAR